MTDSLAPSILLLGVGNPLMHDDGIGPRVVELLASGYDFPEDVEILDAGTMSLAILSLLAGRDHLIVVDAVRATGHAAGAVMRLSPDQLAPSQVHHTMHDVALADVLQAADIIGSAPSTVAVVAVQIQDVEEWSEALSPAVEASVPIAAAAVIDELERLGARATPRCSDVHERIHAAVQSYQPNPRQPHSRPE